MKKKKLKIGVLFICTGWRYWQYARDAILGAQEYLLPDHKVDCFLWSDIPSDTNYGATIFPTEALDWPYPTLLRYHLFTQQEEILKKYDYLFYCDIDMKFVDTIGDEVLGDGITATQHPMYALRKDLIYPFEPNQKSTAYFPHPQGYYAGGFQGGKTEDYLKASWTIKRNIDKDFDNNYIARWNEESHWNKYMFENPPAIVLDPSYCYPDSIIENYYVKVWGRNYKPKLITLTKKFTTSKEGGDTIKKLTESI